MIKRKASLPIKLIPQFLSGIRLIISGLTIIIAVSFIIGYAGKILKNSDYFKIKDIIVNKGKEGFDFSYLVGYNMFALDLKKESSRISELYPSCSNIRLIRVLPNRLFIGFTDRKPLAYVKLYRYFCVDRDSVLLDAQGALPELELPVILGLETKIFGAKAGKQYNIKELTLALNIIREVKTNSLLKNYKVQKINVTNPVNASCFLIPLETLWYPQGKATEGPGGIEVRLGEDNISDKISILAGSLIQLKNDSGNIKYIDLRFKEPVIKLKDK